MTMRVQVESETRAPLNIATFVCPHCGAKWLRPPKAERRKSALWRVGRANRRHVSAWKCCQQQTGIMR